MKHSAPQRDLRPLFSSLARRLTSYKGMKMKVAEVSVPFCLDLFFLVDSSVFSLLLFRKSCVIVLNFVLLFNNAPIKSSLLSKPDLYVLFIRISYIKKGITFFFPMCCIDELHKLLSTFYRVNNLSLP